ncbi:MAG: hypothetical protein DYG89_37300 [Caldilinea sp. CFX5]|nr:hypothetical protein [Caldilinea sp. CFX5]
MPNSFPYNNVDYYPAAPVADITITGVKSVTLSALIDSGSDTSMIPLAVLRAAEAEYVVTKRVRGLFGHARNADLYFVDVQVGNYRVPAVRVIGVPPDETAIIGRDILNHLIVVLDGIGSTTEIS